MSERDARVAEMLDHHDIRKLLATYCFGADRCDETAMSSVYAEDSWDDHGTRSAAGRDFARMMIPDILASTESMSHMLGQSLIRVDGDEAGAETYFLAAATATGCDGETLCNQLGGRFVDRLRRQPDGGWLIEHRRVVRDWAFTMPIHADWTADAGLVPGSRSPADPAFAALGLAKGDAW